MNTRKLAFTNQTSENALPLFDLFCYTYGLNGFVLPVKCPKSNKPTLKPMK